MNIFCFNVVILYCCCCCFSTWRLPLLANPYDSAFCVLFTDVAEVIFEYIKGIALELQWKGSSNVYRS